MCDNPEATPARKPAFIVTIDAEPDNLWAAQPPGTIRNAAFLPRFQELCERHGIRPVYLADYDMASDALFVEFGRDVMRRAAGEIGMHLHAWMTPPFDPSTPDSCGAQPYLIEYPDSAMRAKIRTMTALLEAAFGCCPVSHRAGRWAFDGRYARMLADEGYRADCSVTPHMDWRMYPGVPGGAGEALHRRSIWRGQELLRQAVCPDRENAGGGSRMAQPRLRISQSAGRSMNFPTSSS